MRKTKRYILYKYGNRAILLFCLLLIGKYSFSQLNVTANGVAVNNLASVNLCITQNGDSIQFQTTGVGGAQTVNWVFNSALPNTATGVGPHIVHYTGNNSDTVFVTLTNAAGNIIDVDTFFVFTSTLPNASINPNDTLFCKNDPLYTINGLSPNNGTLSGAGVSNGKFNPNSAGVGSHWITYTRSNGICSSSDSVSFTVIPAPIAALTSSTSAPVIVGGIPLYKICTQLLTPQTFAFTTTSSSGFNSAILDFGDGSSINFGSTITNQTHTYTNSGVYTVTLTVTKNNGCTDIKVIKVFWGSNPGIGISTSGNTTVCLGTNGSTFTFPITPSSVVNNPPGTIYVVTFNDGSPSQVYTTLPTSFTHTFTTTSCGVNTPNGFLNSFYVKVTASNPCGSSSSTVEPFVISEKPESDFTMLDSACKDVYVDIENNSNKGVFVSYNGSNYSCDSTVQIIWDINPSTYTVLGGSSNLGSLPSTWTGINNPQVKFTQAGTYSVTLYIKSQYGTCGQDTITKFICIDSIPDSTFNLNPDTICSGNNVFAAYNSGLVGMCDSIYLSWDISPDTTSYVVSSTNNDSAITWNFYQSGLYDVTLTRQHYCDTSNYTLPLVVEGPPTLVLPPGENICGLDTVNFADSLKAPIVEDSLSPVSYQWLVWPNTGWNYSAGSFPSSSNPKFNFTQYGMYTITLIVSNSCGADTQSIVYTFNEFPVITPISDTLICYNYDASLTASATSGTPGFTFYWGALNGSITDTGNVLDLFNLLNDTSVYVIVEDFYQCTDSIVVNILVSDELITDAGVDPYSCYYDSVQLQGSAQGDTGAVVYSWTPTTGLTNPNTSNPMAFPSDTNRIFYLTVTDSLGCSHTDSVEINIYTIIPITAGPDGALCLTNGLDTLSGFYPTSGGTWSGTGIVSGQNIFNPAVAGIGAHNIVYSYTDGNGCSYTDTAVITVISQPTANFGVAPIAGCGPLVLVITDSSSAGAVHNWDTNGVPFSTVTNPALTVTNSSFTTDHSVSIGLVIIAGSGCSDTTQQNVTVYPTPNANFTIPLTTCALDTQTVIDGSVFKGATATYHWAVTSSSVWVSDTTAITPDFVFADNQSGVDSNFTVTLTITSVDGCTHSYSQNITIYSRPVATFSMPVASCSPVTNSPLNSSTGVGNTYSWSVSPSIIITGANTITPTFNFPLTSNDSVVYQITINVLDSRGCTDEVSDNYTVYPKPTAIFTTVPDTGCSPLSVNFTNSSTSGQTGMGIGTMSFLWSFGNGNNSANVSPSQTFTNTGIIDSVYYVSLISTNAFGCTDTIQDSVTVHPDPISNMVITATANCAPFLLDSTIVSATVYPAANSGYSWIIFDTNLAQLATFTGATGMNYTITAGDDSVLVQLITSNTFGCTSDTVFQWFSTVGDPEANFGVAPDTGCSPMIVSITDSSAVGMAYSWTANGVPFSNVQNPALTITNNSFTSDSIVIIELIITAGTGCGDTTQHSVTVNPSPLANFSLSSTCALDTVMAVDSSVFKGVIASYLWSTSSPTAWISNTTIATPSFVFGDNQSGVDSVFTVTLMVTSIDGCTGTITQNVTIFSRPVASFNMPISTCSPVTNSPINNSTGTGNNYNWSVSPSISIGGSTTITPIFNFPLTTLDSMVYQVSVGITDTNSCVDQVSNNYTVYPKPAASFVSSITSGCPPLNVNFTNSSTSGQTGMDSTTMTFIWNFGNGTTSTLVSPSQTFPNTGVTDSIYTIVLISTNAFGCSDTIQDTITVHPNPLASLNITYTLDCAPFLIDSSVVDAIVFPNTNNTYLWTVYNLSGVSLGTYTGATAMNYTMLIDDDTVIVELVVTSLFGCSNDTVAQMFTTIEDPVANFGVAPDSGCSPLVLTITDSSTVGVSYSWSANGTPFSIVQNPALTITSSSATTDSLVIIELIVTAGSNCKDTTQHTVNVFPKPIANFSLNLTCALDTVMAIDSSIFKGTNASYLWTTSSNTVWISDTTSAIPSFVFGDNQSGVDSVFMVTLMVTSIDGCIDIFTQNITIFSRPVANFSMPISACSPVITSPTNNSTGGGNTFNWSVNPSIVITGANLTTPTFNFPLTINDSVQYQITIVATDTNSCMDQFSDTYTVYPKPDANFIVSSDSGCAPHTVNFTNSSTSGQTGMDSTTMTFNWGFGNGNTFTSVSPSQTFTNTGVIDSIYTVTLISTNAFGCSDTTQDFITAHPNPLASLNFTNTLDCAPFLIDSSVVDATVYPNANSTYLWTVYDITGSVLNTYTGPTAMNYTMLTDSDTVIVELVVTSLFGCTNDTISQMFTTIEDPVANFGIAPDTGCSPLTTVVFDSSSTGVTYQWFANNNLLSTSQSPTFTLTNSSFNIDSVYTIQLIVTAGSTGCMDTAYQTAVVLALPNTAFAASNVCDGDSVIFTDQTNALGPILTWLWDYGNGANDSTQNTVYSYPNFGVYNVTFTTVDSRGCSNTVTDSVTIYPNPIAHFNSSSGCLVDTVCINQSAILLDSSYVGSVGAPINYWEWDINVNGVIDYFSQSPSHTFLSTGNVDINLVVQTQFGCVDSVTRTIYVSEPPTAVFQFDTTANCGPLDVNFINQSYGLIDDYLWTIYVQDTASGTQTIIYTDTTSTPTGVPTLLANYYADTTYYFSCEVSNCCGSSLMLDSIELKPHPVAGILASTVVGCTPLNVTFQLDGQVAGNPDSLILNYGDGTPPLTLFPNYLVNANGDTIWYWGQQNHTFINPNPIATTFSVVLTAYSECGDSTVSVDILVYPNAVQSFFQATPVSGCSPISVTFQDYSVGGTNISWCFDYDTVNSVCNQPVGSGSTVTTTYIVAGTYVVAQFVDDGCGYDTSLQTITVHPSPTALFASTNFVCNSDSIYFVNQSTITTGFINSNYWDFGDGFTSNLTNPVHQYANGGVYNVILLIGSSNGCTDSVTMSITIYDAPEIIFTAQDLCFNEQPVQFLDSSTIVLGQINSTIWDFGDGNTSTNLNPQHTYAAPGLYTVWLTHTSTNGCIDSAFQNINIYPEPTANFTYTRLTVDSCSVPQLIQFNDQSTNAQGFYWDFDYMNNPGVFTSTLTNPTFQFNSFGVYHVALFTTNQYGCSDSIVVEITVQGNPDAGFYANFYSGCSPLTVIFTDTSSYNLGLGSVADWHWDFGDGGTSNIQHPLHEYNAGIYDVTLIVASNGGCLDTISFGSLINVDITPTAGFNVDQINARSFDFTNQSVDVNSLTIYDWSFGDSNTTKEENPTQMYNVDLTEGAKTFEVCLRVENGSGCADSICENVDMVSLQLNVPNALAPEEDMGTESNVFLPKGHSLREYSLKIFDEWGNIVFETISLDENGIPDEPWNGSHMDSGIALPMGAYTWRIDAVFNDGTVWQGKLYTNGKYKNVGSITIVR